MRTKELHKIIIPFKSNIRRVAQKIASVLIAQKQTQRLLGGLYGWATFSQANFLHTHFAKIFTESSKAIEPSIWRINFAGRQIIIPLREESLWLDWDSALSVLGHDIKIKQTYEYLIKSDLRPDLFVDIGANYGTHSLLFLKHGIETLSFEPNSSCQQYFREVCTINNVEPQIINVALSNKEGITEIFFPENATWLGTMDSSIKERFDNDTELTTLKVKQDVLDNYLAKYGERQILIKIDTEGTEYAVLRGAVEGIAKHRPIIVFESFQTENRRYLINFFGKINYKLSPLPWYNEKDFLDLNGSAFLDSAATNFVALPTEKFLV